MLPPLDDLTDGRGPSLVRRKWQLDGGPAKDRKHKRLSPHFRVELYFAHRAAIGRAPHVALNDGGAPDEDGRCRQSTRVMSSDI